MEWKEQREEVMRWFSLYNGVEGAEEEMDLIMIDFFRINIKSNGATHLLVA